MVDYEKGAPRNLVQFSEYNDLAFTDTGVAINDNARPSRNNLWSSDKIEKRIQEIIRGINGGSGGNQNQGVGVSADVHGFGASANVNMPFYDRPAEYYPNGYRVYYRNKQGHQFWRVVRPSWWLSFIIPKRSHYCDKCCNYMEHTWSSAWNDDPKLNNHSCKCMSKCNRNNLQPQQNQIQYKKPQAAITVSAG